MTPAEIEAGYHRARRMFYSWKGIASASLARETMAERVRHFAYSAAWKKAGPVWDAAIALGLLPHARPALEAVLDGTRRVRQALGLDKAHGA
jgi:hypothetical protein